MSFAQSSWPFLGIQPMNAFKDAGHLFRLAAVFLVGFIVFLVLRSLLVPRSFGRYGHYRADAIAEIAALPISYAGHQVCEGCHSDVVDVKSKGVHKNVACEACHGPQAKHADDPASVVPAKLDTAVLCVRCHQANIAKPKNFPQVEAADHSGGAACNTCHQPHSPAIGVGGKQ
jgi:uncharacterized CHY-type Zn-finger protein